MSSISNSSTNKMSDNKYTHNTSCLMCLSNDLLYYIVEFVSPTDIVRSVSLVCKKLYWLINGHDKTCTSYEFWRKRLLEFVSLTLTNERGNALIKLIQHSNRRENRHVEFDVHVSRYVSRALSCKHLHECYYCKDEEVRRELETILDRSSELSQWHYKLNDAICNSQTESWQSEKESKWFTLKKVYGKIEEKTLARLYCHTLCYLWNKEINTMQTKRYNKCNMHQSHFTRCTNVTPILSSNIMIEIKVFDEAGQLNVISNDNDHDHDERNVFYFKLLTLLEESSEHAWWGALLNYTSFQQDRNDCTHQNKHHHTNNIKENERNLFSEHSYNEHYNTRVRHAVWPHNIFSQECTSLFDFYVCASEEIKRQYYNCRCEGFDDTPLLYFDEHDDNDEQSATLTPQTTTTTRIITTSTRRSEYGNHELHHINDVTNNNNNSSRSNYCTEMSFAGMFFPITCSRTRYQQWRDKVQSQPTVVHHDCVYEEMLNNIYCLTGKLNEVWDAHELHSATHSNAASSLSTSTSSISFTEESTNEDIQDVEKDDDHRNNINSYDNCEITHNTQENKRYQETVYEAEKTIEESDHVLLFTLRHILTYMYLLSHITICGVQHQHWPLEKKYAIYTRMLSVSGDVVEFRFFYSYSCISYPRMYCTMMFAPAHIDEVMSIKDKFDGTYTEKKLKKELKTETPISFVNLKHAPHLAESRKEHVYSTSRNPYTVKEYQYEDNSECTESNENDDESESNRCTSTKHTNAQRNVNRLQHGTKLWQACDNEQTNNTNALPEDQTVEWVRHAFLSPVDNVIYKHPYMCHCESVSNNSNGDNNSKEKHQFLNTNSYGDNSNDFDNNEVYNLFWTGFGRVEVDKSPAISAENFRRLQFALGLPSDFPLSLLWNLTLSASGIGVYVLNEHFVTLLQSYKETFIDVIEREFGLEACYGVLSALCSRS